MKLTENFNLSEFQSKDGSPMPLEVMQNVQVLARQLQVLRDELKAPISITSGYRSPAHNKTVGGKPNSYHLRGMAADIQVAKIPPEQVVKTIRRLQKEGKMLKGGLKAYDNFTHYDFRGKNVTW